MPTYYKKLYTKTITLPFIKYEGISSTENSDYYAVLEKNYVPVASTETWDTSTGNWVTVKLTPENTKYNRLSIETCQRNDGDTPRTRIFEFKANVPVTPSDGIMIDHCNSIFAVIRQEPKQVLEAKIEFIPFEETDQTLNETGNELTINGDDQIVKIIYYGVHNTVKVLNNTELKIDGNTITEYSPNVVSLEKTGYGNVLIYKIPQYKGEGNKTINIECIYHGNYDRTETATATIKQVPNVYGEFKLGIGNLDTKSATVQNYNTSLQIYCQLYKNDVLVTNGIKLQFSEGSTGKPYIITKAYTTEVYADHVKFIVPIDKNITPEKRYITVSAEYKTETSNTVTAQQNEAYVNIKAFRGTNQITGDISINGYKQTQEIKYYAEATLHDSSTAQYISYENKLNTGIQKVSLKSEVKTNCTIDFDTPYYKQNYKITTVTIDENVSGANKTSEVYLKFDNNSKTTAVTFVQTAISIVITDVGSTTEFNGLAEFNQVELKFTINEDSSYVTPLANINIVVPSDFELYNTIVDGNTIIYVYNITKDYGITEFGSNDEAEDRDRTCTVSYKSATKTFTITQHPVYFGIKISREPTGKITGTPDNKVEVYGEGIIYNSSTDKVNFITVPSKGITLSDDSYITVTNEPTDLQYISILTFDKNDTGSTRTVTVTTNYKGLTASLSIEQTSVLITLKMAFLIDGVEVSGISQYVKNPWDKTTTVDFIAYITGYVNGEYVIITDVKEGTLDVENGVASSKYFSIDNIYHTIKTVSFENGIIHYRFTMQRTYLEKYGSLKFKYSVTHGVFKKSKYLRLYIPSVTTENEVGTYCVAPNDDFALFDYDEQVSATNGTGRLYTYVKYVAYMPQKTYGVQVDPKDEEVGEFKLTCDGATSINPTITADGYRTFDLIFPDNGEPEEKRYDFTLTYTNKNYVDDTNKIYNRTITKTGTFIQSSGDIELLLSFNSATKVTIHEIDGLPHDDVYIYVQIKVNDVIRTDISTSDISVAGGLTDTYKSIDFIGINGNVYVYKVKDITFNDSNTNLETTYKCNYAQTYSNEITLKQKSLLNDSKATVEVTVSPETVPTSGADTSATFTYCFKYNGTAIDIGNNWETTKKNQDDTDVIVTNESETGAERSCVYTFGENTDTDKNKYVTLTATAFGKTGSATVTQGVATIDLVFEVEANGSKVPAEGQTITLPITETTFILTYYGILNDTKMLAEMGTEPGEGWSQQKKSVSADNITTAEWVAYENLTTSEKSAVFTVSYKTITKTVTIKQSQNSFNCELICQNIDKISGSGESRTFLYYGQNQSGRVIDKNKVKFYCLQGSENISITEPTTTVDGEGNNVLSITVTFNKNLAGNEPIYKFQAEYTYDGVNKVSSQTIELTQQIGLFTPKISFTTDYQDADGNYRIKKSGTTQLIIYYWGEADNGTIINDQTLLTEPEFKQFDEDYEMFTVTKTSGPVLSGTRLKCTYSVSENHSTEEFVDQKINTAFVALVADSTKQTECYIVQLGDEVPIPDFDYFAFKYNFTEGGRDLDTATSLYSDLNNDIYEFNADGTKTYKRYNSKTYVGFLGDTTFQFMKHYGDNMNQASSYPGIIQNEAVTIDIKSIINNAKNDQTYNIMKLVKNSLYVDILGSWYGSESGSYPGKINITFECYKKKPGYNESEYGFWAYYGENFELQDEPNKPSGYKTCEYKPKPGMQSVYNSGPQTIYLHGKGSSGSSKFRGTYAHFAQLRYNLKTQFYQLNIKTPVNCNSTCPFNDGICNQHTTG